MFAGFREVDTFTTLQLPGGAFTASSLDRHTASCSLSLREVVPAGTDSPIVATKEISGAAGFAAAGAEEA